MTFNNEQIQEILGILKRWECIFIGKQLGINYLTDQDKLILSSAGIDVSKFASKRGIVEHAFLFGILSDAVGSTRAKSLDYKQFLNFLDSGNFVPLTDTEEFALEQIKNRAYNDISGLGNRNQQGTTNVIIRANQKQQLKIQQLIKEKTIEATSLRYGARTLASELGKATEDWERDWLRIAYYLLHESYNTGIAQNIYKNYGEDAEIYFDVYEGACRSCRELYLTDPDDPNSEPKVFKLSEIMANGNNIGRKKADWLPTISPLHPYCRCTINHKKKGYVWDSSLRAFTKPAKYVPKNKKLRNIKLDIKVTK